MSQNALIIIDLQNDYYPEGKWLLHNIQAVTNNAVKVLQHARDKGDTIIHVRHEFQMEAPPFFEPNTYGSQIHSSMRPKDSEPVVLKHQVNAFQETDLESILKQNDITDITLVGAMSHMCIDAAARAASDLGFTVTVIEDACASRELEFNNKVIDAESVHAAYMSALSFAYSTISTTAAYLATHK